MSDYPRAEAPSLPPSAFAYDRVFAVVRFAAMLYSAFSYFTAFHARWERFAPELSIFAYAPPLGSHLTSQIFGVAHGAFVSVGLWNGRGWAFAYALLTCLSACVLAFFVRSSTLSMVFFGALYLPSFVYCGLRLVGTLGPPTGGLELRRLVGGR